MVALESVLVYLKKAVFILVMKMFAAETTWTDAFDYLKKEDSKSEHSLETESVLQNMREHCV